MTYAFLPDRAVLAVSGEDAKSFLQGLISNDISKATDTNALFAALLSPQGRFLFDFFIIEHKGRLLLDTDKARLPDLLRRLGMYKLRARVMFTELPQMQVAAFWGKEASPVGDAVFADPRLPELGGRVLGVDLKPSGNANDYERHRISLVVPEGSKDLVFDRSILLEFGYDELGAVDFAKGCYVGQEVTARSKHRASLRKFIHQVESDKPLPQMGAKIMAGAQEAGEMRSSSGTLGLAHLRVEEITRARRTNIPLICEGVTLTARLPGWCKTAFSSEANK